MFTKLKHLLTCPPFEYYKYPVEDGSSPQKEVVFRTCPKCGIMQEKVEFRRPVPFTNKQNGEYVMGLWYRWEDIKE